MKFTLSILLYHIISWVTITLKQSNRAGYILLSIICIVYFSTNARCVRHVSGKVPSLKSSSGVIISTTMECGTVMKNWQFMKVERAYPQLSVPSLDSCGLRQGSATVPSKLSLFLEISVLQRVLLNAALSNKQNFLITVQIYQKKQPKRCCV